MSAIGSLVALLGFGCLFPDEAFYAQRRAELTDQDGDGANALDDCDDSAATVHPGADEICNGIDEDCDLEVDEEALDVTTWYADADGDGHGDGAVTATGCSPPDEHVASADDCDDADPSAYPGAEEVWYDGADEDCAGDDDFDADGDGHAGDQHGGDDCQDGDDAVYAGAEEGWFDLGIDNDCDGAVADQVILDATSATRIDGEEAGDAFGGVITVLPAGTADAEPFVVVTANLGGFGKLYGWAASDLASRGPAAWTYEGTDPSGYLGSGTGLAGADPILFAAASGEEGGRGTVYGWGAAALDSAPTVAIHGVAEAGYAGYGRLISGHDQDGDGASDLVVPITFDSTYAQYSGTVAVFLDPTPDMGEVSMADADITFFTTYTAARTTVQSAGDYDQDGLTDLAFFRELSGNVWEGGGLVVTSGRSPGVYDIKAEAALEVWGVAGPFADLDTDGDQDFHALMGGVDYYEAPFERSQMTAETDADARAVMDPTNNPGGFASAILASGVGYGGPDRLVVLAPTYPAGGAQGRVFLQRARWTGTVSLDDGDLIVEGASAGDEFGGAAALLPDQDGDGEPELVVGATGADYGGGGAGAVYLVASAH